MEHVSIAFVSTEEIKKLNKQYRKKDAPTDVLSVHRVLPSGEDFAEVLICPQVVKQEIKDSGETFKEALTAVLVHGMLHVLGYDHEGSKKDAVLMQKKEKDYLLKTAKK